MRKWRQHLIQLLRHRNAWRQGVSGLCSSCVCKSCVVYKKSAFRLLARHPNARLPACPRSAGCAFQTIISTVAVSSASLLLRSFPSPYLSIQRTITSRRSPPRQPIRNITRITMRRNSQRQVVPCHTPRIVNSRSFVVLAHIIASSLSQSTGD